MDGNVTAGGSGVIRWPPDELSSQEELVIVLKMLQRKSRSIFTAWNEVCYQYQGGHRDPWALPSPFLLIFITEVLKQLGKLAEPGAEQAMLDAIAEQEAVRAAARAALPASEGVQSNIDRQVEDMHKAMVDEGALMKADASAAPAGLDLSGEDSEDSEDGDELASRAQVKMVSKAVGSSERWMTAWVHWCGEDDDPVKHTKAFLRHFLDHIQRAYSTELAGRPKMELVIDVQNIRTTTKQGCRLWDNFCAKHLGVWGVKHPSNIDSTALQRFLELSMGEASSASDPLVREIECLLSENYAFAKAWNDFCLGFSKVTLDPSLHTPKFITEFLVEQCKVMIVDLGWQGLWDRMTLQTTRPKQGGRRSVRPQEMPTEFLLEFLKRILVPAEASAHETRRASEDEGRARRRHSPSKDRRSRSRSPTVRKRWRSREPDRDRRQRRSGRLRSS